LLISSYLINFIEWSIYTTMATRKRKPASAKEKLAAAKKRKKAVKQPAPTAVKPVEIWPGNKISYVQLENFRAFSTCGHISKMAFLAMCKEQYPVEYANGPGKFTHPNVQHSVFEGVLATVWEGRF